MSGPYPPSPGSGGPSRPGWPGAGTPPVPPPAPTVLPGQPQQPPPQQPPPGAWPPGPPSGPPGPPQGPPPPPGFGYAAPPPRRRRGLWIGIGVLALVLIAGLGVGGFLYGTGRLGFGPLSADDEAAAAAIADGVPGPEWADEAQLSCAADDLVAEHRSSELEESGLVTSDGDDWVFTGDWETDLAEEFAESVLTCSDDWQAQLGAEWSLAETDCLGEIGTEGVADFLVTDALEVEAEDAVSAADETAADLDECYAMDVTAPAATAEPAYRSVRFLFAETAPEDGTSVTVAYGGREVVLERDVFRARADAGDEEVCITTRVEASYPWGTSRTAERQSCGVSAPKRVYWRELSRCSDTSAGPCRSWALHYEGFASESTVTATLRENGGDCGSVSGQCTFSAPAPATGRGVVVTWSAPPNWGEDFTGTVGDLEAVLPN